jgi:hypothetical protein
MNFLLIFYFIFLVAFVAFNIYAIIRVWSLKLTNDNTQLILVTYMIIISSLILISLIIISGLDWSLTFKIPLLR